MFTIPSLCCIAVNLALAAPVSDTAIRTAVAAALPPLRDAAISHIEQKTCFGCHNQGPPTIALVAGQGKGFAIFSPEEVAAQAEHIRSFIADNREKFRSGRGTGGQVDTAGSLLLGLEQTGEPRNEDAAAVVEYLLKTQSNRDHWRCTSNRPPSEASHFTTTYLALRGLRVWGMPEQQERIAKRIAAARDWLTKTPANDTEDHVFRLLALREAGADRKAIENAVEALITLQRPNGGWAQLPSLPADAYATGTALVALNWAGNVPVDDPVYRRGIAFLVHTQRTDGTWLLKSRSKPFQPYYEGGFPHGKNQFISSTASGWAAAALLLASLPMD